MTDSNWLHNDDLVHVWTVPLSDKLSTPAVLLLSPDERERAERFRFGEDRYRFVNCRAALRRILGHYLKTAPGDIRFRYSEFGKPELEASNAVGSLKFNVSHAGAIALIAVTRTNRVGVDVELLSELPDLESLAATSLSDGELRRFRAVATDRQGPLFFKLWTCKEALAKADGRGLSAPQSAFDFDFPEDDPCRLASIAGDRAAPSRWSLFQFIPASGYMGAVALESSKAVIEHFRYESLSDCE